MTGVGALLANAALYLH